MGQITVTQSEIETTIQALEKANDELMNQITQLSNDEKQLCGQWEGDAKQQFDAQFNSDIKQMNAFYDLINRFCTALRNILNKYVESENKNVTTAETRTYSK